MEVEDEVKLADVAKVLVENLHEGVDEFEDDEFVIGLVDDGDEVQAGVALVHDLVLLVVDEVAHLRLAGDHQLIHLRCYPNRVLPSGNAASPVAIGCSSTTSSAANARAG